MTKKQFLKQLKNKKEKYNIASKNLDSSLQRKISNEIYKMIFSSKYKLTEEEFDKICVNLVITTYTFYLFYNR